MSKRRAERRDHQRADARLSMRVEVGPGAEPGAQIVTESQNISASGVYCHAAHYVAPLSKVALTIVLPGFGNRRGRVEMVKCEGVVVRCEQLPGRRSSRPYELACAFTGLDDARRRLLGEFVTWRNLQALRAATRPRVASRSSGRRTAVGGGGRASRAGRTRRAARSRVAR